MPETIPSAADSTEFSTVLLFSGKPVSRLDIFVYGDSGVKPLESYFHFDSGISKISYKSTVGKKITVAIANSPKDFNTAALSRYDAMESLEYGFEDDNSEYPIMSGISNGDTLSLSPLLCSVRLASVTNSSGGWSLLEKPRIRLLDIPKSARALQFEEFRPSESLNSGKWAPLPYDIGFYTQHPGTTLYCYPNDTPETTLGAPHVSMEMECTIEGEIHSFPIELPPLERGTTVNVEVEIDSLMSCSYKAIKCVEEQ